MNDATTWTHFWDMHSGGSQKEECAHILIEAPEAEAKVIFYNRFGHNPERVTCTCCGPDYSISEGDLAELTGYHRNLRYASPLGRESWRTATADERRHANEVSRYLEPGEPVPDGWHVEESTARRVQPSVSELAMADPHFPDFSGKRHSVLLIRATDIKREERVGSVPDQGYVWVEG